MSADLIERLAREAGFTLSRTPDGRTLAHGSDNDLYPGGMPAGTNRELRRFAALLAEECAKICAVRAAYYRGDDDGPKGDDDPRDVKSRRTVACESCAASIRANLGEWY